MLAVRRAPTEIQKQIRQQTKAIAQTEWQRAMAEMADTRLEHRVLVATSRVAVSNQNIKLSSATVGKALSGGLQPKVSYPAVEFGATRGVKRSYSRRSRNGGTHNVSRRTAQQLRPRNKTGHVFYPAAARMIPRIAALWAQTVVRTFAEALEGK